MKTLFGWDLVSRVAKALAHHAHNKVDMDKKVLISFRTALIFSIIAEYFFAKLKNRILELQRLLPIPGSVPNKTNTTEELQDSIMIADAVRDNCLNGLREAIAAELHSQKNNHQGD